MAACPRCGSRRVHVVRNLLIRPLYVVSAERKAVCASCGWTGWKHANEWRFSQAHANDPTAKAEQPKDSRRRRARRRQRNLVIALIGFGLASWMVAHAMCA